MPDLPAISVVTTCKGRLEHLRQTLPLALAQPFAEAVVVDFDCPDGAGDWVARTYPSVKLVRVTGEPRFQPARARNLGAAAATSPWLLFLDADIQLAPGFLAQAAPLLTPGVFVRANPRLQQQWGTIFVSRADFEALEGYDEVFENWSGEDTDLLERLRIAGVREDFYDGALAIPIPHDDALRVRHHHIEDVGLSGLQNGLYRTAKLDLARQGVALDADARRRLLQAVRQAVTPAGIAPSFEVTFRRSEEFCVEILARLKYDLKLLAERPMRVKDASD